MQLTLLGPLNLTIGGRVVAIERPRCRAVLAFLALSANRTVSIERIVDALWHETPPATARAQVHADISAIRRAFRAAGGHDPITTSAAGYLFKAEPGCLDIDDFVGKVSRARVAMGAGDSSHAQELLVDALSRWRGPALADVSAAFVQSARARFEEQRIDVEESLAELRLASGEDDVAIEALRVLIDEHPLRERSRSLLMLALYRRGRRSDALQMARDLRRVLVEEEGLDPGPEISDLETKILRDDASLLLARGSSQDQARPARTAKPAQLPGPVAWFTGRESRLSELDAAASGGANPGSSKIIVVTGLPGVGKTSLAIQWAHQVRDRFPDGQLFIDLRGYAGVHPVRPIDALAAFLRALGVPRDRIPIELDETAALYRSTLADRRVLVVLDNARDANQIRLLLPGTPGCVVIVTSRDELLGLTACEGAFPLALDPLSPDQSHRLLARMLGKVRVDVEPAAAAAIAELCGHLPLALRIVAAASITRPDGTLGSYINTLRRPDRLSALEITGDPQASVRKAFESSFLILPTDAQLIFRMLGIMPVPTFTAPAVAALAAIAVPEAADILNQLARANMVDRRPGDSFTLHDLLRQYALSLALAAESRPSLDARVRRLQHFYLSNVNAAADMLYPQHLRLPPLLDMDSSVCPAPFADAADARAWLDSELVNILAIIDHASQHGSHAAAWHLADGLRGYFDMRVAAVDWLTAATTALHAADAEADIMAQAAATLSLAHLHRRQCRWNAAETYSERAITLCRKVGWREGEMASLSNLAAVQQLSGRVRDAIRTYTEVVTIGESLGHTHAPAAALGNLGIIEAERGHLLRASEYFQQALLAYRAVGARGGEGLCLAQLGETHHRLGLLAEAEAQLNQALLLHQATGDRGAEAETWRCLAALYCDRGRHDEALQASQRAATLIRATGQARYEADALNTLATVQLRIGDAAEALHNHCLALKAARQSDNRRGEASALLGIAASQARLGRHRQATHAAAESSRLAHDGGFRLLEGEVLTWLACHLNDRGDVSQALNHARSALTINEEIDHGLGIARSHTVLAAIMNCLPEPVLARHHASEAQRLLDEIGLPDSGHAKDRAGSTHAAESPVAVPKRGATGSNEPAATLGG